MSRMAVAVMPIADVDAWQEFADEIEQGGRGEAHRDFLRIGGVTTENVFRQRTPMGDLMVIVWEGVDQDQMAERFRSMMEQPSTEHEHYLRDYVIPKAHGVDVTQPPPPPAERVAEITT